MRFANKWALVPLLKKLLIRASQTNVHSKSRDAFKKVVMKKGVQKLKAQ